MSVRAFVRAACVRAYLRTCLHSHSFHRYCRRRRRHRFASAHPTQAWCDEIFNAVLKLVAPPEGSAGGPSGRNLWPTRAQWYHHFRTGTLFAASLNADLEQLSSALGRDREPVAGGDPSPCMAPVVDIDVVGRDQGT